MNVKNFLVLKQLISWAPISQPVFLERCATGKANSSLRKLIARFEQWGYISLQKVREVPPYLMITATAQGKAFCREIANQIAPVQEPLATTLPEVLEEEPMDSLSEGEIADSVMEILELFIDDLPDLTLSRKIALEQQIQKILLRFIT